MNILFIQSKIFFLVPIKKLLVCILKLKGNRYNKLKKLLDFDVFMLLCMTIEHVFFYIPTM